MSLGSGTVVFCVLTSIGSFCRFLCRCRLAMLFQLSQPGLNITFKPLLDLLEPFC